MRLKKRIYGVILKWELNHCDIIGNYLNLKNCGQQISIQGLKTNIGRGNEVNSEFWSTHFIKIGAKEKLLEFNKSFSGYSLITPKLSVFEYMMCMSQQLQTICC